MIDLKSYVVMKEELDGDNIQWKFNNWSKGVESSVLDAFMLDASYQKDIEGFKKLVGDSGINFNALTDVMNDDAKGLPDNYDNIYVLKKIIDTINMLNKGKNDQYLRNFGRGTALEIRNDDLQFVANVYVATNKDQDRQIFLRQSIISQDKWDYVSKEFNRVAEKINDSEAKKPFTFVEVFTITGKVEFFYIIDTDKFIPVFLNHGKGNKYEDDECLDNYSEADKTVINTICKAMNQNHKDI